MNCKTCGNDHPVNYCPDCGEQVFNPHQLSVKHFVEETFEGFIHFDSKFFRTVKLLVTKPGQLSLDYSDGKRVRCMKPIQFFLVVNLIFFIAAIFNLYSLSLNNYINYKPFTNYGTKLLVDHKIHKMGLSLPDYTLVFNEKIKALSKAYIFVFIPFYGALFGLLFWRCKQYFVEHLVFATHFMSFILLLALAGLYLVQVPYALISRHDGSGDFDQVFSLILQCIIALYAGLAIHRFYKPRIIWTIVTALLIGITFFTFIQYYRMMLFFKIIYL